MPHAQDKPLTIVVPMAGRGSRFADVANQHPGDDEEREPDEDGRHDDSERRQREHVRAYGLEAKLEAWAPGAAIVQLDGVTEGAACSVLTAECFAKRDREVLRRRRRSGSCP